MKWKNKRRIRCRRLLVWSIKYKRTFILIGHLSSNKYNNSTIIFIERNENKQSFFKWKHKPNILNEYNDVKYHRVFVFENELNWNWNRMMLSWRRYKRGVRRRRRWIKRRKIVFLKLKRNSHNLHNRSLH